MTHREFVRWGIFFRLFPFDDERCFDAPAARVAAQVNRSAGGRAQIEDFLPHRVIPPAIAPTPDDPSAGLRGYFQHRTTH